MNVVLRCLTPFVVFTAREKGVIMSKKSKEVVLMISSTPVNRRSGGSWVKGSNAIFESCKMPVRCTLKRVRNVKLQCYVKAFK